jgi:4-hydroxybutyryl-CoA dehydratase/vinylacetyl-CoA-Delta-isomerase
VTFQLRHGACHAARCAGRHGINALCAVTYDVDKKLGTNYHDRFKRWAADIQRGDLAVSLALADVTEDTRKGPSKQASNSTNLFTSCFSSGISWQGSEASHREIGGHRV